MLTSIAIVGGTIILKEVINFAIKLYNDWTLENKVKTAVNFLMQFDANQNDKLSKRELQSALDSLIKNNTVEVVNCKCLIYYIIQAKKLGYSNLESNIRSYYTQEKETIKNKLVVKPKGCDIQLKEGKEIVDILDGIIQQVLRYAAEDIWSIFFDPITFIAVIGGTIIIKEVVRFAKQLYNDWILEDKVKMAVKFLMQFDANQNDKLSKRELQSALDSLINNNTVEVVNCKCLIYYLIQAKKLGCSNLESNIRSYYTQEKERIKKKLVMIPKDCYNQLKECKEIVDILDDIIQQVLHFSAEDIWSIF